MPQISVIVPVYNVEKYLHRCIDSILGQTFSDFDLILVDDGSPDRCGAICDEYAAQDSRVRVIHQQNGGLSAARNAGLDWVFANSDSQWISFIDSDDWVHPQYLEALFNAVDTTGFSIAACEFARTEGVEPKVDECHLECMEYSTEKFYCERNVTATIACAKLYRRACFQEVRFPVGKIHEDEFVTYQVLFQQQALVVVEEPLYAYYQNANGIMLSAWSQKHMDKLPALIEQITFFERTPFQQAYRKAVHKLLSSLTNDVVKLGKNPDLVYAQKEIQGELRKYLRKYKKVLGLSLERDCYYYEAAYPLGMRFFWYWKAIQRKLGL